MTKLEYKTRGNSDPQRKPRVFFACHPKDFSLYFHSVSEELLSVQNCAVFYTAPDAPVPEEDLLSQMQLVVVPITTRLLSTPSDAADRILPFAADRRIPILPLMMERGLDELFTKKFGNIQYLDPNQTDLTAISYSVKLCTFLSSILVDDSLAEKVRAAFDAYVFLSYRKKDRKHAQQLMKLIHDNDFCRDIAIWYDEYLTPGENFNDAIRDALIKSDLFAIAVTPNLINEPNYVMSTEYPLAKEMGKRILPALLVPTDGEKLAACYEGIPRSIDASDPSQLAAALAQALREIALRKNDQDPRHNFFIGLAYLNGIDVEIDHDRAYSLISSAAESGCEEAAAQLVAMYRSGIGVARDYCEAVRWQEKLVDICRQKGDPDALFDALVGLCKAYISISQPEKIRSAYLLDDLDDIIWELKHTLNRDARLHQFRLYLLKGELAESREGNAKDNRSEKALHIAEEIAKEEPSLENRRRLALCYIKVGDSEQVAMDRKLGIVFETNRGIEWYEDAITLSEAIVKETGAAEDRRMLAAAYERYAVRYMENHPSDDGYSPRVYLTKGLEIQKVLAEESRSPEDRRGLIRLYCALGMSARNTSRITAKDHYTKALHLAEELASITESLEDRRCVAFCCRQLGNALAALARQDEAENMLRRSVSVLGGLAAMTGAEPEKRELAAAYEQLGKFLSGTSRREGAIEAVRSWISIAETLRCMDKDTYFRAAQILQGCGAGVEASALAVKHAMLRQGLDMDQFPLQ